jgi:ABC-type Fe3+/spermidine/putrescine transport system ATPase subunit
VNVPRVETRTTARSSTAPVVEVSRLWKRYGGVVAVGGVSLTVGPGELLALLGPSGCGKTTTLRAIAGFERPDEGEIVIGGERMTHVPPNRRNVAMVFQGYALFPHMTVFDNVAFGLKMRKAPADAIAAAVARALGLVRLTGYESRLPKQLSGGQQQRVAVARALAVEPRVLLLDEPLSNLDAKLRQEMRVELKAILKDTAIATVFVTHDQEEALVLSDRIILMNQGVVEQEGTPWEIYERPRTSFAAAFIGQGNFFRGTVTERRGAAGVVVRAAGLPLRGTACGELPVGTPAVLTVRQERVRVLDVPSTDSADTVLEARVELLNYLGASVQLVCSVGGQTVAALVGTGAERKRPPDRGAPARLSWREADALVFEAPATDQKGVPGSG